MLRMQEGGQARAPRSITLRRSITGSLEPLATTWSRCVETPLHSTGSAAQIYAEEGWAEEGRVANPEVEGGAS